MNLRFVILGAVAMIAGCAAQPRSDMTPLEIQSMQSREFDTNKQIAFGSVVSVFQDLGYTIKSADINTGFITAESTAKSNVAFQVFTGSSLVDQTLATAYVEEIGARTSVRLNFVARRETSSYYGSDNKNENAILDVRAYQVAFEKIENAIFVRSANQPDATEPRTPEPKRASSQASHQGRSADTHADSLWSVKAGVYAEKQGCGEVRLHEFTESGGEIFKARCDDGRLITIVCAESRCQRY